MTGDERSIVDHGVGEPDHLQRRRWTPHRMSYIVDAVKSDQKVGSAGSSQPFTDIPAMSDEDGLMVARGELVYAVLNLYPYNPGHLMVVPYRRCRSWRTSPSTRALSWMAFTQKAIRVMKAVSRPHGFNVGLNLGTSAGFVGRAPAHARGAALGRRRQLHHDHRWRQGSIPQLLSETRELLAGEWARQP